LSNWVCRLAMFRAPIALSANELLLLGWLSFEPTRWPVVVSVSGRS
jgi:hypothetical protein